LKIGREWNIAGGKLGEKKVSSRRVKKKPGAESGGVYRKEKKFGRGFPLGNGLRGDGEDKTYPNRNMGEYPPCGVEKRKKRGIPSTQR